MRRLNRKHYADVYFPNLIAFLRADLFQDGGAQVEYAPEGDPFDYASIMIYSSDAGARIYTDTAERSLYPLMRKTVDGSRPTAPGSLIWNGGSGGDLSKIRISAYDVKRVAEIYPGTPEQQAAAARLGGAYGAEKVNWAPSVISIPGFVDRLMLLPNPFDLGWIDQDGKLRLEEAPQAASIQPEALSQDLAALEVGDDETNLRDEADPGSGPLLP